MLDVDIFRKGIKKLELAYRTPLSQEERDIYYEYLNKYESEIWLTGIDEIILQPSSRFPSIGTCNQILHKHWLKNHEQQEAKRRKEEEQEILAMIQKNREEKDAVDR